MPAMTSMSMVTGSCARDFAGVNVTFTHASPHDSPTVAGFAVPVARAGAGASAMHISSATHITRAAVTTRAALFCLHLREPRIPAPYGDGPSGVKTIGRPPPRWTPRGRPVTLPHSRVE